MKPRGGDLVLLEIQPKVYEVFQLLGFSQFFNIKDSLDEAVEFFSKGGVTTQSDVFPKLLLGILAQWLQHTIAGPFHYFINCEQ